MGMWGSKIEEEGTGAGSHFTDDLHHRCPHEYFSVLGELEEGLI